MRRFVPLILFVALAVPSLSAGAPTAAPVAKIKVSGFGSVLARPDRQALYYWNRERRNGPIRCTGACARAWPPYILGKNRVVRAKIAVARTA